MTLVGAVLFADASGFTALTQRLSEKPNGAEKLCAILNRFFTSMLKIVEKFGGDVCKVKMGFWRRGTGEPRWCAPL